MMAGSARPNMPGDRPLRVFVTGPDVLTGPAAALIARLRDAGIEVTHSPYAGEDPRFRGWYDAGLAAAVAWSDAVVIVPVTWWDSSTWMGIEADAALGRARSQPGFPVYAWSPAGVEAKESGLRSWLWEATALPREVDEAVATIVRAHAAGAALD